MTVSVSMSNLEPSQTAIVARTFTLRTLAQAAGVTERTLRHYLTTNVIPRPPARGRGTVYSEEHLWRLRAARRLRLDGASLPDIKRRLSALSLDAVRALVEPPAPAAVPATTSLSDIALERWERASLLPGLELMVRADASPVVMRVAREIVAAYRAQ